jgi:hypothetical protein
VSTIGKLSIPLLLLLTLACRPRQTGPDANYEKASRIYQQLYASELDDAYGDPKMNDVVQLLNQVEKSSVDAPAAQHLLELIKSGKTALDKQRADREKMGRAAAQSASVTSSIDPAKIIAANTPDAGPMADPYGAGALVAAINAQTGGCLQEGEPFREQVTNTTGTVYRLAHSQGCVDKLPGFVNQVVLTVDGKIYRRAMDPTPNKEPVQAPPPSKPDAGAPPASAAPAPAARPSAASLGVTPSPADAGEPEMQMVIPGAPTEQSADAGAQQ